MAGACILRVAVLTQGGGRRWQAPMIENVIELGAVVMAEENVVSGEFEPGTQSLQSLLGSVRAIGRADEVTVRSADGASEFVVSASTSIC